MREEKDAEPTTDCKSEIDWVPFGVWGRPDLARFVPHSSMLCNSANALPNR